MATRTIVTSQPDVACDVCERRLLRGEQPDVFIAAGRRRIVCELCAPRAANEGWIRERDTQSMVLPPARQRRGRTLFDRFRNAPRPPAAAQGSEGAEEGEQVYEFLDAPAAGARPVAAAGSGRAEKEEWAALDGPVGSSPASGRAAGSDIELALSVFNASEFPRRVAGVARSLGAPEVSVRRSEHLESLVEIVIAWELCWYRYEVDLADGQAEARVTAQGTELSELHRDERLANAAAADSGMLMLAAA
jgi:hypothetical protein